MPDAVDGKVRGEDERREARLQRLRDDVVTDFPILEDVDLQPAWRVRGRCGDVGGRRGRDRRQAHQRLGCSRATRHRKLALLVRDLLERHRRHEDGHRDWRAEHGRLGRHRRDVDEDARPQPVARERVAIPLQRPLVPGSADDVAPRLGRDDRFGQALGVVEGEELLHGGGAYRLVSAQFSSA